MHGILQSCISNNFIRREYDEFKMALVLTKKKHDYKDSCKEFE